jgi:hypothetical protein
MTSVNNASQVRLQYMLFEGIIEALLVAAAAITFGYPVLKPESVRGGHEVHPGVDLQKALDRVGSPLRLSDMRMFLIGLTFTVLAVTVAVFIALGE